MSDFMNENYRNCDCCNIPVQECELEETIDGHYCMDCSSTAASICSLCGRAVNEWEILEHDLDTYCSDCAAVMLDENEADP